jgi:DNA-binding response OmpR family regulator
MADILLLEPNRILAKNYTLVLQAAGHTVRHCARGQMAIEAADQQTPELVILELQIPKHNGVEFLYEFRSYPEWQKVPVVVLSVVPPEVVAPAAVMAHLGISMHLYKPNIKLHRLVEAVDEILNLVEA